jgi:hexosaminidase
VANLLFKWAVVCSLAAPVGAADLALVPAVASVSESAGGEFVCGPRTAIHAGPGAAGVAAQLAEYLRPATGFAFPVLARRSAGIALEIDRSLGDKLGNEGYRLDVNRRRIAIRAAAPAGLFYGVQTLRQLLPPAIYAAAKVEGVRWAAPGVAIEDSPRFRWRGALVDVARHFMPKADLYRFIEAMAAIKLNRLHLHLTDNQAWRIEIRKYPRLTEQVRPTREEQVASGCKCGLQTGFYTQDDLRQIVAYAAARFITVMPEIEIPGHAGAAVTAMPEMGNVDAVMAPEKGGPYRKRVFSPHEKTIQFLQDVLAEVIEVFPSELIHTGGDEVRKDEWQNSPSVAAFMREKGLATLDQVQISITARMQQYLASRGRRLIGWDEITRGGLDKDGVTVMAWSATTVVSTIKAGYDVVLAPLEFTYFDYYQSRDPREPLAHNAYLPLRKAYEYEPVPADATADQVRRIRGAQGQLWTESIPSPYHLEYMAFPRLAALAEVVWSPAGRKDYAGFKARLVTEQRRWSAMGVNYRALNQTTDEE